MQAAYVVTVNLPDDLAPDPVADAEDIEDAVVSAGFDVISVNPWNRPSTGVATPPPGVPGAPGF